MNKKLTPVAAAVPLAIGLAANVVTSPRSPARDVPANGLVTVTRDAVLWGGTPNNTQTAKLAKGEVVSLLSPNFRYVRTRDGTNGWVDVRYLTVTLPAGVAESPSVGTEAGTNPACPPVGTHTVNGEAKPYAADSDAGLRNLAKRHIPASGTPSNLTLADFAALQDDINRAFSDATVKKTLFTPNRNALHDLETPSGTVSEGGLVQLAAFVTAVSGQGPESVNCGGVDGTDIHINVGEEGATEFEGIVAEMIPQLPRPTGWDVATLRRLHDEKLQALLVGGLTYDNEHLVNKDRRNPIGGQPKRMSLWEIHPVTELYVCARADGCDPTIPDQWTSLADWASAHPQ